MALGIFYGYQWGRLGEWWSVLTGLATLAFVALIDLLRHLRRWRGHPAQQRVSDEVPDALPEEWQRPET